MDYKWPQDLKLDPGAKKALEAVDSRFPSVAEWPEDEKIRDAEQPKAMAEILIPQFHTEIQKAVVAYLFVQQMGSRNRTSAAKTSLLSGKMHYLSDIDFLMVFNWTIWRGLNAAQRAALVDHELEHCGVGDDGRFIALTPDIQEFNSTVRRWGPWQEGLVQFLQAAKPQMDMFTADEKAAPVKLAK